MELYRERVCGIDIGKATVVACVRIDQGPGVKPSVVTRTFFTTTAGLLKLRQPGLMCARMLKRIGHLDKDIADIEIQIQVQLLPYAEQVRRPGRSPGLVNTSLP